MGEVLVVDSQGAANLVPSKQWIKGTFALYTLLGLALFGVFVEGALIYQLYQRLPTQTYPENIQYYKQIGGNTTLDDAYSKEMPITKTDSDTKPAAFLHYDHKKKSYMDVLQWNSQGFPAFSDHFNYINGTLIILKDGTYFLFSKVAFGNCKTFKHEVKLSTERYGTTLTIMVDRYSSANQMKSHEKNISSSYLGGVFKLHKNDK
ncbi:uncharacterized protein LOC132866489 isoform X2 [Neoarius graeffei]|nr:uncharacterized protein LOC132866489 isoform X2 [Neoarius graeffei]